MNQKYAILLKRFYAWQRTGSKKDLAAYFAECLRLNKAVDKRTRKITPLSEEKRRSLQMRLKGMHGEAKRGAGLPAGYLTAKENWG